VYKGLVVGPNLRRLFPDLNDSDFQSAIGLFHQRYSTNTFPMWYTAQPFRMLAHNGEINTLQGNLNWMRMREESLESPLFGEDFQSLLPVVQAGGSDSANLDNVFEMLVQCGRSPLQAMAMLVPEAYEGNPTMDARLRAFYEYQRTLMEPWDGPAALCFTDGRVAAATMDRNGLRPLRYWLLESGKLVAGSEVGIVGGLGMESVVERGRLGPGDMMAVDTRRGALLRGAQMERGAVAVRCAVVIAATSSTSKLRSCAVDKLAICAVVSAATCAEVIAWV
jgi:glutamine phosphoribosylpyrophosphate amidotransferase